MTSSHRKLNPPPLQRLLASAVCAGLLSTGPAKASGYYLLEADLRAGVTEGPEAEGGLGLSLYSDELAAWVTIGDASATGGRRIKEWWLDSRTLGPVMGSLPAAMEAAGFDEPVRVGKENLWIPFRSWSFGADYTTGRWLEWDASHHVLINLATLTRVSHRSLLFGPTVGVGANLSWWEGWRGNDTRLINTGKITAEAGWIAGVCLGDISYAQARLLTWVDAFGLHQRQLRFAGVIGFSTIERGFPLGLELQWELERGDDTVDLQPHAATTIMLAATWRLMPSSQRIDPKEVFDALEGLHDAPPEQRSEPLHDPPPPDDQATAPEPVPDQESPGDDTGDQDSIEPEDQPASPSPPPDPASEESGDSGRRPQGPAL